ncbi:deoxycytidyl transferase [Sporothrix stenoceras]|uniref:Deoxycytidyl transferase n=1 Tax=Sporothrix stenoceras TaxID=5173 RepID=A0ABR3Z8P1_9PEZI
MTNRQLDKNSAAVRKQLETRKFEGEDGEEYDASRFGEFGDYFRRKKLKLLNEDTIMRQSVQGKPQIFKDVTAHVASYTQPPAEELRRLLVLHGAAYIKYLDYKTMVTHIIASTLPPKKADEWRRLRVVRPAWVVDSIAAGRMLPWHDYRLINEGPGQKRIQFDAGGKMAVKEGRPDQMAGYREQSKDSYYADQMKQFAAAQERAGSMTSSIFRQLETTVMGDDDEHDFPNFGIDSNTLSSLEKGKGKEEGVEVHSSFNPNYLFEDIDIDDTYLKEPDRKPEPEPEPYQDLPPGQGMLQNNIDDIYEEEMAELQASSPSKLPKDTSREALRDDTPRKPITSEEHNAMLLADPKIRKASTANPDFLKQFYSESRLHHLSTWKAELKSKMQRLAAEKGRHVAAPKTSKNSKKRRYVMHVDFDSFFCAVSLNSAPEYIDKPAAVAHSAGNASEIASCNYPARKFGVKNGMWMRRAMELCPDLKVLPYDFPAYEEASALFYEAILDVGEGSVVQSVSVDEALVDITSIVVAKGQGENNDLTILSREQDVANTLASNLRQQIKAKTGCDVSVGIGGNILLAKVALRRAKPAGQFQMRPEDVLDILGELKVDQLPGVAYSIGGKLDEIGVKLVSDLRALSKDRLVTVLGPKTGERLYEYARGIDYAAVGDQPVRKSVSAEVNWGIRFVSQDEAEEFVSNLCKELERRLLNEQVKGRSLTMKIMKRAADAPLDPEKHLGHGKCDVFNKSVIFGVATHDAEQIAKEAVSILRSFHFSPGDLRGLGVQLQKLEPIRGGGGLDSAVHDSSQTKLSFGNAAVSTGALRPAPKLPVLQQTADKPKQPRKSIFTTPIAPPISRRPKVEEPKREEREISPPSMAFASTQFFMPANPDPSVLAELPPDIIRRLVGQQPGEAESRTGSGSNTNSSNSRNLSPIKRESRGPSPAVAAPTKSTSLLGFEDLPPDIDPEVFEALPPDMRAEVLAEYRRNTPRQQSDSPASSPHRGNKTKAVNLSSGSGSNNHNKKGSPVKRGIWGTRGLAAAAAARERRHDAQANRVQTSIFVPLPPPGDTGSNSNGDDGLEELDPEVLAALPDDMREEVLEDYRRRKQARLDQQAQQLYAQQALRFEMPASRGRTGAPAAQQGNGESSSTVRERRPLPPFIPFKRPMLQFPPRPPKMSFRASSSDPSSSSSDQETPVILSLADTKAMLKTWHSATRGDGPHETDVEVFERYLAGVITQECDMEKARKLVVWLEWLVEDSDVPEGYDEVDTVGLQSWQFALGRIKEAVQLAMQSRGLGPLQF